MSQGFCTQDVVTPQYLAQPVWPILVTPENCHSADSHVLGWGHSSVRSFGMCPDFRKVPRILLMNQSLGVRCFGHLDLVGRVIADEMRDHVGKDYVAFR